MYLKSRDNPFQNSPIHDSPHQGSNPTPDDSSTLVTMVGFLQFKKDYIEMAKELEALKMARRARQTNPIYPTNLYWTTTNTNPYIY